MSDTRGERLRVAAVGYLNARPLYEGLDREPACVARASSPARRRARSPAALAEDEADVALMPVAAAATIGDLRLVRGCAIGARGAVRSVLVVARAARSTSSTSSRVDLSSRTSVVLARLVLRRAQPGTRAAPRRRRRRRRRSPASAGARGALVIGDPALEIEGRFPHALDLGLAWWELTRLPFVFAAWCGRAGRALGGGRARCSWPRRRPGLERRDAIADEHAARTGLSPASLRAYLRDAIRYDLGDDERRGLERFYDEAAHAGLLPRTRVRFFDEDRKARRARARRSTRSSARAADGERLSAAEGERLLGEASLFDLGLAADAVRRRKHPHGVVTYIVDRNVNYTNVCTTSCRFCAFYRPARATRRATCSRARSSGKKLQEVVDAGGVQILLQGGLHPELRIEWYEDLFRWMKSEYGLGLHALSPEEILHIAQLEGLTVRQVLERLHAAGLDSVPGGGAEILVDRVRRKIAKAKCTSERVARRDARGAPHGPALERDDDVRHRRHAARPRRAPREDPRPAGRDGGFTAFFCWDFQHEQRDAHRGRRPRDACSTCASRPSRASCSTTSTHVGASWVTQGPEVGQVALRFGADDFGSVMFEENVVSSAGTTFCMNADAMEKRIRAAGFKAARRNVRYDWLTSPS